VSFLCRYYRKRITALPVDVQRQVDEELLRIEQALECVVRKLEDEEEVGETATAHIAAEDNPHSVTHSQLSDKGTNTHAQIDTHLGDTDQHVGDWTDYTTTWTGNTTNPTLGDGSLTSRYRRVGQSFEYFIQLKIGSVGGGADPGSGLWSFSLAHTIDTSAFAYTGQLPLGVGWALDSSVGSGEVSLMQVASFFGSTTSVGARDGTIWLAPSSPFTWAEGDTLTLYFSFPVA
jgi:hypothetical protein